MVFNGESNENGDDEDDDVLFNRLDREQPEWGHSEQETLGDDEQGSLLDTDTEG